MTLINKVVLIGAGLISDYKIISQAISADDLVICADGGLYHANKMGITPTIAIGDFDSYTQDIDKNINNIILPADKDDSDTFYAVKYIIKNYSINELCLLGLTGGRADHYHSNLQVLRFLADYNFNSYIYDEIGIVRIVKKSITLHRSIGKIFSVFSYSDVSTGINIIGAKYNKDNFTMKNLQPIGLSNEITSNTATIEVKSGSLIVFHNRD